MTYVRSDGFPTEPNFEHFKSLARWEGLGKNETGDHHRGCQILVLPQNSKPKIRRVRQKEGGVRYSLDQRLNPDSAVFSPGGVYGDQRVLVCGHIGTASESRVSIELYKAFVRLVTKGFEKIRAYRVGPEAARLMDEGYRMVTTSLGSPPAYDLRRDKSVF